MTSRVWRHGPAVLGALLALAPVAAAQPMDSTALEQRVRIMRVRDRGIEEMLPGILIAGDELMRESPAVSQHPFQPLTVDGTLQLREAQALRLSGRLERARTALDRLLAEAPHHPAVVTELARLLLARQDHAAVERLGRAARAARRDSLLVGRELALALERLGRPRDAAGVALEAWLVSPGEGSWAQATITRLAPADIRGVRDLMRRAVEARPERSDVALVAGTLDWRAGDLRAALSTLERAERPGSRRPPLRWSAAEQWVRTNAPRDSGAAIEALVQLAGDGRFDDTWRLTAAQRAWELQAQRGTASAEGRAPAEGGSPELAPALTRALRDVPTARWSTDFLVALARRLRETGHTDEARALLRSGGAPQRPDPQVELEQALADLRDGPPERALPRLRELAAATPDGAWRHAEALFFAGQSDSALACYQRIASDPRGSFSGAALERAFLIEDAQPRSALPVFGRIAYAEWRGATDYALVLADSLVRALPHGALWAQASLLLSARLDASGDARAALAPLLAVADSLPEDRLAPLARQRAGDLYLLRLEDERAALDQYEECLARYPRAWNAPEVRRRAETLRRERRF